MATYQLAIKVIRNENPLDIQPDIFGLRVHYLLIAKWCHSWDVENTSKFHLTLFATKVLSECLVCINITDV